MFFFNRSFLFGTVVLFALTACGGDSGGGDDGEGTVDPVVLAAVQALFPDDLVSFPERSQWNAYVQGGSYAEAEAASGAKCAGTEAACIHAGELRVVQTDKTSCADLTASDALGAFEWTCDASVGTVRLISTGLAIGKGLTDLIDFDAEAFKPNWVNVFENGTLWGQTPESAWWSNVFEVGSDATPIDGPYEIYLVLVDPGSAYQLTTNNAVLVIKPGTTISAPGATVVQASNVDFAWFEGGVDATSTTNGIVFVNVKFSALHNVSVSNSDQHGVYLDGASNNTLSTVTANNNHVSGVRLFNASNNTLAGVTASNNGNDGVFLFNATNNTLSSVAASNNGFNGVFLHNATNNRLSSVTANNNSVSGVFIIEGSNNTLAGVTASNNGNGVILDFLFNLSNNNTLSSVIASNNDIDGVRISAASNYTLSSVTASNNGNTGVSLSNSSNSTFTGLLKVGNNTTDCVVSGGTNPGLIDQTCANDVAAGSDAELTTGITLANSFVGKVAIDDTNTSHIDGTADFPADPSAFDWSGFDNPYRGWGIDGSAFPSADHRGSWTAGTGRVWDWSLSAADDVVRGVLALPNGDSTLTHTWNIDVVTPANDDDCATIVPGSTFNGGACETTFLRNSAEIPGDGIGNDNGLCESDETCLYAPNIGSYQGHGELIRAGSFTDGTLTGITLMKFESNGR